MTADDRIGARVGSGLCAVDGEPARCARVGPHEPGEAPTTRAVRAELPPGARRELVHLAIRYEGRLRNLPSWGQPDAEGPFMDDALGPDRVELALCSHPPHAFARELPPQGGARDGANAPAVHRDPGPVSGGQAVQQVYSPRDWGQGYARPGLVVVSEGRVLRTLAEDPDASFLQGHAHEAAHFWWRFGSGQGDWINETFAEYFALLAVRSIQGEDEFRRILEREREDVRGLPADAPALAVVPFRNDGHGYTIRYHKGALMLDAFRKRLGDDAFLKACRRFFARIEGRRAGTPDFRVHWREVLEDDDLLSAWLDSSGSSPVTPAR